jgi:AcrR family transcriptional regulator
MAQVKKSAVRDAILSAGYRLFRDRGYNGTTLSQIAQAAGISTANVYSYFESKFDILYSIYDPWLSERFRVLENDLLAIRDPRKRLQHLVTVLWRDIPAAANGFSNNIMQAVSGAGPEGEYDPSLLRRVEALTSRLLRETLPPERLAVVDVDTLAHVMFMAFDGFAMSAHANPKACCGEDEIDLFCRLVLGETGKSSRAAKRTTHRSRNGRAAHSTV